MISEEYRGAKQWSRNKQALFAVVWISFLCAAVSTMVFFAVFDPVDLTGIIDEDLGFDRDAGYAIGFVFFWIITLACSGITAFLVRTAPKRDSAHRSETD